MDGACWIGITRLDNKPVSSIDGFFGIVTLEEEKQKNENTLKKNENEDINLNRRQ